MRDDETLVGQIRALQIANEELKDAQLVGKSQLLVKQTISDEITITSDSNGYISEAYAWCEAQAPSVTGDNVLIAYSVAEIRTENNLLVDNVDPAEYTFHINNIKTAANDTVAFQLTVYHSSQGGETIPVENYKVKFYVWSAAKVNLTAQEGLYGA